VKKVYAIGDIHGCLRQLKQLVELCEQDAGEHEARFIFLGDYIDRGPDSKGVIEFLMSPQNWTRHSVTCLYGNHEDLLLAAAENEANEPHWLRLGGEQTLLSYGVYYASHIPADHLTWIRSLPLFYDDDLRFFVHAGIRPDQPLHEQNEHDMIWIREPFLSSDKLFERYVCHGHTPLFDGLPDVRHNRVNIDTGAVFGRPLTAAVFEDDVTAAKRFLIAT
jgi:serine/threonine protein phosphatase 1